MKEAKTKYRLLVHCDIHQIREGFEANLRKLPAKVHTQYADLLQEGILSKLKFQPHLIVVLLHEGDSDFLLPLKIKLFARNYPVLVISPTIPESYYHFLRMLGVDHIIQLPAEDEDIRGKITDIMLTTHHGKP